MYKSGGICQSNPVRVQGLIYFKPRPSKSVKDTFAIVIFLMAS